MRHLSAFEHGWLAIGEEGDLSSEQAGSLAKAQKTLPAGCLEWGYQRVKFTQFCGVVQIDELQIEVLPKLYPNQSKEARRRSLLTMLHYAGDLKALDTASSSLNTNTTTLLDLFIRHFAQLLELQIQQGLLRDYEDIEDTLGQVRGRIDLIRQQRENLFKPHRLACEFNELIADIPVNRLLHSALLLVTRLSTSPELQRHLNALRHRFAGIGTLSLGQTAPRAEELNRLQQRYAPVVELAHQFLNGQFLDARSGEHQVFSLLFDMNQLFERYAAKRLRPEARSQGLRLIEQGPRRYLAEDDLGRSRLLMRPDITLVDQNGEPQILIDTKWKQLGNTDPVSALSASDLYQVATYAAAYECRNVQLLYPEQPGLPAGSKRSLNLTSITDTRIVIEGVPLDGG
ncbi:McrC family protein [Halomonadaceae bacterium KBTZ08]